MVGSFVPFEFCNNLIFQITPMGTSRNTTSRLNADFLHIMDDWTQRKSILSSIGSISVGTYDKQTLDQH